MILFTTGLPGHGKGAVNMKEFERKLVYTERVLITSMTEIEVPKLGAYLREKYPKREFNLDTRLRFIEKRDVGQFYRYRGRVTLPPPPKLRRDMSDAEIDDLLEAYFKPITEGEPCFGGVEYMITEAHRHFRSEAWSEMSRVATFYLTQHRHFDDNVVIETQLPKQVVIQMRDLGEETWEMVNRSKQQMGWWQKPKGIEIRKFNRVPKTDSADPFATETFQIEPNGIHGCYRTRGAVGVGGGTPETEVKKKALPFWTIFAAGAAVLLVVAGLIWSIPQVVMGSMGWFLNTSKRAATSAISQATPTKPSNQSTNEKINSPVSPNRLPSVQSLSSVEPAGTTPVDVLPKRVVTGYITTPTGLLVQFSDGTRETTDRKIVTRITINGKTYGLGEVPPGEQKKMMIVPEKGLTRFREGVDSSHGRQNQQSDR